MTSRTPHIINVGVSTIGTAAAQVTSNYFDCEEAFLQADPDNVNDIFIGNSSSQPIQLVPGQALNMTINNMAPFYAKTSTSTALLNWIARI